MSKLKALTLSVILATCVGTQAYANEAAPSPVDMLLAETLEISVEQSVSKKISIAHFGKDKRQISTKSGATLEVEGKDTSENKEIDHIFLNLGNDKSRCEDLEKKFTASYGAPKSRRHNIRIWEITNSDAPRTQSKNVTIMAGEEGGKYFVIIDRRGPSQASKILKNPAVHPTSVNKAQSRSSQQARRNIDYSVTD